MIKIKDLSELTPGTMILLQGPDQKFSHECLKVKEIKEDEILFTNENNGKRQGEIIPFPKIELLKCFIEILSPNNYLFIGDIDNPGEYWTLLVKASSYVDAIPKAYGYYPPGTFKSLEHFKEGIDEIICIEEETCIIDLSSLVVINQTTVN